MFSKQLKIISFILVIAVLFVSAESALADKEKKEKKKKPKKHVTEEVEPLTTTAQPGLSPDSNYLNVNDSIEDSAMSGMLEWKIQVVDDNDNSSLPPKFRNWWYTKINGLKTNRKVKITIAGDGWRGGEYVLPVYSYNRKDWFRIKPDELFSEPDSGRYCNYSIIKKFDTSSVWLARYYPYTLARLNSFIDKHKKNPYFKTEVFGKTYDGRPLTLITITDPNADDTKKKRVWIQARTHPSETPSSFEIEGLIDYLLSECNNCCNKVDLTKLIFNIVPIVNVDGVAVGNSRITPGKGVDLERQWLRKSNGSNTELQDSVAIEVRQIEKKIRALAENGPEFIIALNLHSTNATPLERPFLFSNFRRALSEHGAAGDTMLIRQLNFVRSMSKEYCGDTVYLKTSYDPGLPMDKKIFPESWWWVNYHDKVMAATIESTTGINGCFEEWVSWRDHLKLGEAIAFACQKYYSFFYDRKWFRYDAPSWDMKELSRFYREYSGD